MASAPDSISQDKTYPDFLGKRYDSISKIGQGGMGAIYKAYDNDLLKDVVIKVIVSEDDYEKTAIEFQKEAKALSRLKNDNLVTVYDFGISESGTLYMVLEYVEGETLSQFVEESNFLSPSIALPIFIQICNGLIHAHSNHVIHRDLKPANIIVGKDSDGEMLVKILDFGIARVEDGQTTSTELNTIKGSPFYLAPEVIKGKRATEQSDIYSLSCLMYKTLTGVVPFEGETIFETFDKHTKSPIPKIIDSVENCPVSLSDLIEKCMSKIPSDRYNSITEIKEELDNIYLGKSESKQTSGIEIALDESFEQSEKKSFKALVLVVTILLIGIAGLTVYSLLSDTMFTSASSQESEKEKKPLPTYTNLHHGVQDPFVIGNIYGNPAWEAYDVDKSDDEIGNILSKKKPMNISIMHSTINGSFAKKIVDWPITTLRLENSTITDKGIMEISKIKTLVNLDITASDVTDKGLTYLYNKSNLSHLEISMCRKISESGVIKLLEHNKSINSIKLSHLKLSEKIIPYLVSRSFDTIEVANTGLKDKAIRSLAKVPNLRCIDISRNPSLSNETFLEFAKLPNLGKLEFSESPSINKDDIVRYRILFKAKKKVFNCKGL